MELAKKEAPNFFEEYGLEVKEGEVEVGQTYPIFGVITNFLSDRPGKVMVEINHNITASIYVYEREKVDILKQRAFESGIFVVEVLSKEPMIEVECKTVIFGRSQASLV